MKVIGFILTDVVATLSFIFNHIKNIPKMSKNWVIFTALIIVAVAGICFIGFETAFNAINSQLFWLISLFCFVPVVWNFCENGWSLRYLLKDCLLPNLAGGICAYLVWRVWRTYVSFSELSDSFSMIFRITLPLFAAIGINVATFMCATPGKGNNNRRTDLYMLANNGWMVLVITWVGVAVSGILSQLFHAIYSGRTLQSSPWLIALFIAALTYFYICGFMKDDKTAPSVFLYVTPIYIVTITFGLLTVFKNSESCYSLQVGISFLAAMLIYMVIFWWTQGKGDSFKFMIPVAIATLVISLGVFAFSTKPTRSFSEIQDVAETLIERPLTDDEISALNNADIEKAEAGRYYLSSAIEYFSDTSPYKEKMEKNREINTFLKPLN